MLDIDEFRPNHRVMNSFIRWIEQERFDRRHASNWAHLYHADPEAAMAEASFWAVLGDCGVTVEPNADLTGKKKAPDFRCQKDSSVFYVEVTCIRCDTATRKTSLQSIPRPSEGASFYNHLNEAIFHECVNKTRQCADLDTPCILAVGTFHFQASVLAVKKLFMEWLLTGQASLARNIDLNLGRAVGDPHQVTSFRNAPFTRMTTLAGIEDVRQPISALLVGGFGCDSPHVLGLFHPNPVREFDPATLERIPFCRGKIDVIAGTVSTEWVQTPAEWDDERPPSGLDE